MVENNKIIFKIDDYVLPCSYKKCKNDSAVHYPINGKEKHLCQKHFDDEVNAMNEQGVESNANKIYNYFAKIEEQRNRPKNSGLKLSSFNDYYK